MEQFRQSLNSTSGKKRKALVEQALKIGHPFVLPWLDDLLYEPGTRVAAAQACLKIGGQAELAAVINSLGRLNDAKGDRQLGEMLDQFTGERMGSDRNKWNEWLKAQTPRTPLPGDEPEKEIMRDTGLGRRLRAGLLGSVLCGCGLAGAGRGVAPRPAVQLRGSLPQCAQAARTLADRPAALRAPRVQGALG